MKNPVIRINNFKSFIQDGQEELLLLHQDQKAVVMYSDITGFQLVNDFYGFVEGDRFLDALDDFLVDFSRTIVSGRFFSDHYLSLIVMEEKDDIPVVMDGLKKSLQCFLERQRIYHQNCRLNLACGYCIIENKKSGLTKAIDNANLARKVAKSSIETKMKWFDDEMREQVCQNKIMEIEIQKALMNEEFVFYLQPKVDLNTGKVIEAEALARLKKTDGKLFYPENFTSIMESNAEIMELDFMIYRKVCIYLNNQIAKGKKVIPISINISKNHIYQLDFVERVHAVAQKYEIPSKLIGFEITESILLEEWDSVKKVIDRLREYGYKISIDDFGIGYTGLNLWKQLEFDEVKLDRSFISIDSNEKRSQDLIIMVIAYIARMQKNRVLCEGVETEEECHHMKELGCGIAQGFYFSPPLPVEEFEKEMEERAWHYSVLFANKIKKESDLYSLEDFEKLQIDNFYREIYDLVDCAIIEYQSYGGKKDKFRCISLNNYAAELFGFPNKDIVLSEKIDIINDFVIKEDLIKLGKKVEKMCTLNDSTVIDFRIRRLDGTIRYVTGTIKFIMNTDGKLSYLAVLIDKSARQEVERLKEQLNTVMENTPGDIVVMTIGKDGMKAQYLTQGLFKTFGYSKNEFNEMLDKNNGMDLIVEPERKEILKKLQVATAKKDSINLNFHAVYKNNKIGIHNLSAEFSHMTENGEAVYHGIIVDITKISLQEKLVRRTQKRYLEAIKMLHVDVWSYDFEKNRMELPVAEEISELDLHGKTHLSLEEFLNSEYIHPDYIHIYLELYAAIRAGNDTIERELMAKIKTGEYQWFYIICHVTLRDKDGNPLEMVGVSKNINEDRISQRQYQEMQVKATRDSLTGIWNREAAGKLIRNKIKKIKNSQQFASFFLFDIDNFKYVNDTFGHIIGDKVLQTVCRKVEKILPEESIFGRLGGDEFILFISDYKRKEDVSQMAEFLCKMLDTALMIENKECKISISMGCTYVEEEADFDELYRQADTAMYFVKNKNKNGYYIWKENV